MKYKQYLNQSNKDDLTNIFETSTGMLNIAPIKISGQYKIVIDQAFNFYLDDYTGRRKLVNKDLNFLQQVSDFLQTNTSIKNNDILRFGGFQTSKTKSYHLPLYIGFNENTPKYFVLSKVANTTITDTNTLYNGSILKLVDLEKIGLQKIFNEINSEDTYNFPVYFNLDDDYIKIFGLSLNKKIPTSLKIDNFKYFRANQSYIENVNNKILNSFSNNNLIFPKFLNIEFEFTYDDNFSLFNNFYGYFSYGEVVDFIDNDNFYHAKIKDFKNSIEFTQLKSTDIPTQTTHSDIVASGSIQEITEQIPMVRFSVTNIDVNYSIKIYDNLNNIDFEYTININDIVVTSLYQTLINISDKCNKLSKRNYIFSVDKKLSFCILTIKSNIANEFEEYYYVDAPFYFKILDRYNVSDTNYKKFRGITINDVWLCGQPNLLDSVNQLKIKNVNYQITNRFKFYDKTIIRLNKAPNIEGLSECQIFEEKQDFLIELKPIAFLSFNSDLKSILNYDGELYCNNLEAKFTSDTQDVLTFKNKLIPANLQFIQDNETKTELETTDTVLITDYNTDSVKNMNFVSIGQNSNLTPNLLNISKYFYQNNCCVNVDEFNNDQLRYNWFLIKGECPSYLQNDYRELRYFDENSTPKIYSRVYKITESLCETIFLGVKYQLPLKYNGYSFAVYIDCNDTTQKTVNYKFDVDNLNKRLFLVINNYLDFQDLIRQGNINNPAFLDLSFFYSVADSFNKTSNNFEDFKQCQLKICTTNDDIGVNIYGNTDNYPNSVYANLSTSIQGTINYKQKRAFPYELDSVGQKQQLIIKNVENINPNYINDLTVLFSVNESGADLYSNEFYLYSTVMYNGELVTYKAVGFKLFNVSKVTKDYVICEDVSIQFYPEDSMFVTYYDTVTKKDTVTKINKQDIESYTYDNTDFFEGMVKTVHLTNGDEYKLLLPLTTDIITFKQYYFELYKTIKFDNVYEVNEINTEFFKFDEFFNQSITKTEIFDLLWSDWDGETSTLDEKITLLHRNQVFYNLYELFQTELKFKQYSEAQVRKIIDSYMVTNLSDFVSENSIQINQTDEYIKLDVIKFDSNLVVWNFKNKDKIYQANRYKAPQVPYLPLFDNEFEFQLDRFKKQNSLFNIYDVNFGGTGVSATGIWSEVFGNIVSSLFCMTEEIVVSNIFSTAINYYDLLKKYFNDSEKLIITNKNENYIGNIDKNIDTYIIESFIKYLLNNFYVLDSVTTPNNEKIEFTYNSKNNRVINLNEMNFGSSYKYVYLIFKRK